MRTETLFSSYEPIHQYEQLLQQMLGEGVRPVIELKAIDAFLMKQMVSSYPIKPTVIDVAAAATLGSSTVFWAAHPGIQHLYIMPTGDPDAWRPLVNGAMKTMALPDEEITFCDGNWATLQKELNPLCPPMAMLGVDDDIAFNLPELLNTILNLHPHILVFLFPVGDIATSRVFNAAWQVCNFDSYFCLTPAREISPYFFHSQMTILYRREGSHIPYVMARIRQLFEGNFDFLTLLENLVDEKVATHSVKVRELEKILVDYPIHAPPEPGPTGRFIRNSYEKIVPEKMRLTFRDARQGFFDLFRGAYHSAVPMRTRLAIRDFRVRLIGR